jgi:hypothetical protein
VSDWEDTETILVGDRRMRVRRRLTRRRPRVRPWVVVAVVAALAAVAVGVAVYATRPRGFEAVDGSAVTASGAFQTKISSDDVITVAMEVRNIADEPVTLVSARLVPPDGLTPLAIALIAPDERNQNLNLDAELPPLVPISLGTEGLARNGIVAARFAVDCDALPPTAGATGERVFVTVRIGDDERQEELTPPVVAGVPWLTATARGACAGPITATTVPTPLPTL